MAQIPSLFLAFPVLSVSPVVFFFLKAIEARVAEELKRIGQDAPIAVLPEGPMTIPYLS